VVGGGSTQGGIGGPGCAGCGSQPPAGVDGGDAGSPRPAGVVGGDAASPRPAGFPACLRCPYRRLDHPAICLACSTRPLPAPIGRQCPVCEQPVAPEGQCRNTWCGREDRWFSTVWSVSVHSGALRQAIASYKFGPDRWWAGVFARLLVGYLDEHMPWFDGYGFLVPMPAFTGPGARRWPANLGTVTKTAETPAMTGQPWLARRGRAEGPLRRALRVPDPSLVVGRRVLVVDDVFTEGSTLREVARALVLAGAEEVAGLTVARQPWRPVASSRPAGTGNRRAAA
jgi:predicted amidophosphoribosyltransferase